MSGPGEVLVGGGPVSERWRDGVWEWAARKGPAGAGLQGDLRGRIRECGVLLLPSGNISAAESRGDWRAGGLSFHVRTLDAKDSRH